MAFDGGQVSINGAEWAEHGGVKSLCEERPHSELYSTELSFQPYSLNKGPPDDGQSAENMRFLQAGSTE